MTTPTANPFSDELIAALEDEWLGIEAARHTQVESWHEPMRLLADEYYEMRRRGAWVHGPADFFGILGRNRDELSHSAMLAWLLDPDGRHGLGRALLDRVIADCFPDLDAASIRIRSVETEVQRGETRADIVIWGDTATIIIEVKIDAGEGIRQCDRLYERFSDEPGVRFLFLTPSGREPLTATGDAASAFVAMSFRRIRQLVEEALAEASGGAAAGVVANYLTTMRREFR